MNLFGVLQISGSALKAERLRAEVVTSNMANAETTRTPEGGPFKRRMVVFATQPVARSQGSTATAAPGVAVRQVLVDNAPAIRRFDPTHPDADAKGYVSYPDINPIMEMTDLMGAVRAYDLNASAVQATKSMIQQSLDILQP